MSGLLIVSNRLPITVQTGPDGATVARSTGGIATALRVWPAFAVQPLLLSQGAPPHSC